MNDLLEIALAEYGLKEIAGSQHEERILEYFKDIGHEWVKTDETAWCSAFINWCAKQAGLIGSGKLNARSWLDVGTEVTEPELGDVVVFWRESKSSWKGHVGIYISTVFGKVYTLGGNQDNMVCVKPYPKARVLGYRRLQYLERPSTVAPVPGA